MPASGNTTTPVPDQYATPPFPSLYWLVGPANLVNPRYLYHTKDVWRFTLFWTIIIFEAAHLTAGSYAVIIVWWGSRDQRSRLGMGKKKSNAVPAGNQGQGEAGEAKHRGEVKGGIKGTGISGMWVVPVVYGVVAGVEGVLAGSVVGLLLGAIYNAGGYRMSTWIPFVWSLISVLVLIVSSFSIQGGL